MWNEIKSFLGDGWDWLYNGAKDYLYDVTIGEMKEEMKIELASYIGDLKYIFVIIAIIGLYLTMSGNREKGTKITSFSIITYLIVRVVFSSYGF